MWRHNEKMVVYKLESMRLLTCTEYDGSFNLGLLDPRAMSTIKPLRLLVYFLRVAWMYWGDTKSQIFVEWGDTAM